MKYIYFYYISSSRRSLYGIIGDKFILVSQKRIAAAGQVYFGVIVPDNNRHMLYQSLILDFIDFPY